MLDDKGLDRIVDIMVGILKGEVPRHKHKCKCGCVWEHDDAVGEGDCCTYHAGHTCPACGNFVTTRYGLREGETCKPTHLNHHLKRGTDDASPV